MDYNPTSQEESITRRLSFVRTMFNNFEVPGPDGPHLCLAYEPMREPLWLFQRRWESGKLPPALLKVYLRFLLRGLDYFHSECHIIYTGEFEALDANRGPGSFHHRSQTEQHLTGIEHPSATEDFVRKQAENPMPRKIKDGRSIYLSHSDFGHLNHSVYCPR